MFRSIAFLRTASIIGFVHEFVSLNGELLPADAAVFRAVSSAVMYAKGVFTTLAIYGGEPFLCDKHRRRLEDNCERTGIAPINVDVVESALRRLIDKNGVQLGRARLTLVDESSTGPWSRDSPHRTSVLITTADARPRPAEFRIGISPFRINSASPLAGIKSCNYLEKLIAYDEAKTRGFNECVQVNDRGAVTSAVMSNIFWLKDGTMFTPALATGCLAGTTREFVLERIACDEVQAGVDELNAADQIFVTSAGLGVVRAAAFNGRTLDGGGGHPITDLLPG